MVLNIVFAVESEISCPDRHSAPVSDQVRLDPPLPEAQLVVRVFVQQAGVLHVQP
jgi:hypothetical protein